MDTEKKKDEIRFKFLGKYEFILNNKGDLTPVGDLDELAKQEIKKLSIYSILVDIANMIKTTRDAFCASETYNIQMIAKSQEVVGNLQKEVVELVAENNHIRSKIGDLMKEPTEKKIIPVGANKKQMFVAGVTFGKNLRK